MPISRALKDAVRNVQARAVPQVGSAVGGGIRRLVSNVAARSTMAPAPVSPPAGLSPKAGTLMGRVMRPAPQVGKAPLSAPVASAVGQVKSPYSRNLGGGGGAVRRTIKRPVGGIY